MPGDSETEPSQDRPQQGRQQDHPPQEQQGHVPRQPSQRGQSNPLQEWTVYGTALFALAGAALGLFLFLVDTVDEAILSPDGAGAIQSGFGSAFAELFIMTSAMVAIFAATFVGVWFSRTLTFEEGVSLQIAGAVGAAGTIVVVFIVTVFNLLSVDNVSLEVAGLLINGSIAALIGGLAGAGGFWTDRNQTPTVE